MTNKNITLENNISYKFSDKALLKKSLTHKSFDKNENNEILEFLGDRILGLVISEKLISEFPNDSEGVIDKKFSKLVNKTTCYKVAQSLILGEFILLGPTELNSRGFEKKSILANACESLIGALYLDGGYSVVKNFIIKYWDSEFDLLKDNLIDPKSFLQEWTLGKYKVLPEYKLLGQSGPDHNPTFCVQLFFRNYKKVQEKGSSIKDAEMKAADSFIRINKLAK